MNSSSVPKPSLEIALREILFTTLNEVKLNHPKLYDEVRCSVLTEQSNTDSDPSSSHSLKRKHAFLSNVATPAVPHFEPQVAPGVVPPLQPISPDDRALLVEQLNVLSERLSDIPKLPKSPFNNWTEERYRDYLVNKCVPFLTDLVNKKNEYGDDRFYASKKQCEWVKRIKLCLDDYDTSLRILHDAQQGSQTMQMCVAATLAVDEQSEANAK